MSLENLDLIDRRILSQLDKNSRISYSTLGKRIRVAKETVKYRIKHLQKIGIIRGFYTVINFSKMNRNIHRVYLRLQNTSPQIEKEIIEYLSNIEDVCVLNQTNGPYNIALGLMVPDVWQFERFWLNFKKNFGEYLSECQFAVMTEYLEFSRSYLLPKESEDKQVFVSIDNSRPEKLDELDFKLLSIISNNARASLVDIAKKLDVSIMTVRHRIKKLTAKGVIVGFRAIFDLRALGREYYKVDLWFKKFNNTDEVRRHILSHREVIYTERTTISGDLEFDVETLNFETFIRIMESFKEKFPDDIRDYTYYSLIRNFKIKSASWVHLSGMGQTE